MKPERTTSTWGTRSASYWMTMLVALGIIFIGARFIINPRVATADFGIPLTDAHSLVYGRIKGIRDIFSGLVLMPFLLLHMRRATAWALTMAIIVPATDCTLVLMTNGPQDITRAMVHGGTAIYMVITSILLFRNKK